MSQASEELFTIQEQMEAEMTGQGLTRYWRNVDRSVAEGDESSTSYGLTVLKRVINPVAARIEEVVAEADSGKPGRRSTAIKYLRGTSSDLIAYLTVKVLLDSVSRQRTLQSIAIAIGQRLEDEARFRKFNDENPALFQVVSRGC